MKKRIVAICGIILAVFLSGCPVGGSVGIGIAGVWSMDWKDLNGNVIQAGLVVKFNDTKQIAYGSITDYWSGTLLEDSDIISYDNSTKSYTKHFIIHPYSPLIGMYQKSTWILDGENLTITTYTPHATADGVDNDQNIFDRGYGMKLSE
jgi:hypothetical protein